MGLMRKAFKVSAAIVPAAVIVVGLLLLAGCGNSDSDAWSGACGSYIDAEHEACVTGQHQAQAGEGQTVACQEYPHETEEACIHGWEHVKEAGFFGSAKPVAAEGEEADTEGETESEEVVEPGMAGLLDQTGSIDIRSPEGFTG
jgi:hypothetical protein